MNSPINFADDAKIHSILLVAVFLSVTFATWAGPVVNQYFPMNNGDNRFYQDSADNSYTATEYLTQTTYNGHSVFSLNFHDEWDGYPYAQDTWYLGNNSGALALYGITTAWGSLTFNSPANLFTDQTLTNNGSLTSAVTGVYYAAGLGNVTFNITVQTTVSSIPGTITVPAGTFANCKLVEAVETATVYGVFQQAYDSAAWVVAPGVGVILDGAAEWDVDTGQFTTGNGFGGSVDYLELVSGKINNVPIDYVPPSNVLSSWPPNGTQLYINPLFIWGTASDAGLGGSGIAQVTLNGSATSNDTVAGSGSAVWSTYTYLVPGTNTLKIVATDGAGNSTTNYLTVVEMLPAPTLTTQPASQAVAPGANVSFSVIPASSLLSLSYQWHKDGTALTGATNSNFSITGVQTNQAGNYSVVVTNASGSITSSNAYLFVDGQKPTITITNPAANAQLSNAVAQVSGKATDNGQVTKIFYKLNAGGWLTASGTSNWQASVTLIPGTNIFYAYSVDWVGNISATNSQKLVYVLSAPITLKIVGAGTVGGAVNGQMLPIGQGVTLMATAGAGYVLTNWLVQVGGVPVLSTNKAAPFLMQSNLVLTATFVDVQKPVLTLTAPTANQRWSNAVFTVAGKVTDNGPGGAVWCQLNGGSWATASGWSNWTEQVTLIPGTNIISAYAVDVAGNVSATNSQKLVYVLSAPITLKIVGNGTVGGTVNGQMLPIGQNVTLTATAGAGYVLTNWLVQVGGVPVLSTNKAAPFLMQSNLVLTATFVDVQKPVLTLTAPTANQRWSNAVFTVAGKVTDNGPGGAVWCQLNGGSWATASGWSNWTEQVTLIPGTNIISAYAVDLAGNVSATTSQKLVYVLSAPITLNIVGNGTVSGVVNGQLLPIGQNVTLTATPGAGFAFYYWSGDVTMTTNKTLTFIMASNLTINANFRDVTKPAVKITAPVTGQTLSISNGLVTVTGTASDNAGVAGVGVQVNNGGWTPVLQTTSGFTNWTANLPVAYGTNTVLAYAMDAAGNVSPTNTVVFVNGLAPTSLAGYAATVTATVMGSGKSLAITKTWGDDTWAENGKSGDTNASDYSAGSYSYFQTGPNTAVLTSIYVGMLNDLYVTNVTTDNITFTSTTSATDVWTNQNDFGIISGTATATFSRVSNLLPATLAGKTIEIYQGSTLISAITLNNNGTFNSTNKNGSHYGTYTFTQYSPTAGILHSLFNDPNDAGGDQYLDLTFTSAIAGQGFGSYYDNPTYGSNPSDFGIGTFTIK